MLCFIAVIRHWPTAQSQSLSHLTPPVLFIFFPLSISSILKGSYGVVKLAYNEDDDKYYVSIL